MLILLFLTVNSCCLFIKATDLGKNFVLSEYDDIDKRILYTEDKCSGMGIEVVPMSVLEHAYNKRWIIAKSSGS